MHPLVLVFRDRHESLQKCSLTPLRGHPDLEFREYPCERAVEAAGRVLLHPDGELLSPSDAGAPLLLVDSSWRRLPKLLRKIAGEPRRRRLPPLLTAYPRRSNRHDDPEQGLASVEALYAALLMLGHPRPDLLESYRWKELFLKRNPQLQGLAGGAPTGGGPTRGASSSEDAVATD